LSIDPNPQEIVRIHQENRVAWNEAANRYEDEIERDVAFLQAGGKAFHSPEWPFLQDLHANCRRAIHLQCAGGLDTLSLWNHGAQEVVGVDISERMIECACRKADALGASARWVCCDVLDTPHDLDGTADLVYTGKGSLLWIMDLGRWAKVVARLLKPQGRFYLFEGHPLTWVWDPTATEYRLDPDPRYGNYFSNDITSEQGWPTEYMPESAVPPQENQARKYERQWTLSQIVNALADAGLRLKRLEEHPDPYWNQFPNLPEDTARRLPQSFSLLMSKE
jgi:SAM-dependent methyltransferase